MSDGEGSDRKVIPLRPRRQARNALARDAAGEGRRSVVNRIVELKKRSTIVRTAMNALPAWVTPNGVTVFRTLLIAPIVLLLWSGSYWSALLTLAVAMLLDFVDGALAEARDQKSEFGAFLDPLGDKVLVCGTLLALLPDLPRSFRIPVAAICLIAVALTLLRILKTARRKQGFAAVSVAAKPAGKMKMLTETAALFILLAVLGAGLAETSIATLPLALLYVAAALGGMSFLSQLRD